MSTINYTLSKCADSTGKSQILVRVSVSRTFRVGGKTKLFINPKDWNEDEQSVRKCRKVENIDTKRELEALREQLNKLTHHISKALIEEQNLDTFETQKDKQEWLEFVIDSFYDPAVKLVRQKALTFEEFAKVFVEIRSKEENWKPAKRGHINQKKLWDNPAFDKLSAVQTQLREMNPKLLMADITGKTLDDYQDFLVKKGFKNTTIENHNAYFKQILKWANERGYLKHGEEVIKHKVKKLKIIDPKAVNYLHWDEFLLLYNYEFDELHKDWELARDRFCFCCLTSLRHSDLSVLKKSCFDHPDDPTSFTFVSKKTDDNLTIYLNEMSKKIYMKYKDIPTDNGLLFPTKSGDKMRRCLKNIAKALNIDREITITRYCGDRRIDETIKMYDAIGTHTARRTFVVHCLEMGWSPDDIMSYTGHEDYDTMKPYIDVVDKKRKDLMKSKF